jgi:hypothetical protein
MRERIGSLLIAVALAACATTPPVPPPPPVVTPEKAAQLLLLVRSVPDPASKVSASTIGAATNAVAGRLREAGFRVTVAPKAPAAATVTVSGGQTGGLFYLTVDVEANGVVVDRFDDSAIYGWEEHEIAAFGEFARYRLERSEALASLAEELAAKPHARGADQPGPWVKTAGASAATRRLAVLEFRGPLAPNLLALLSDQARAAAVEAVRPHGIAVMTRENTAVMLRDQGRAPGACTEGDCEVDTARLIGAHLVVTGEVSRVGSAQFLQMKLFDAEAGTLLASKQADATDDLALVKAAKPAAAALFE